MKTVKPGSPTIPGPVVAMGGRDWTVPPLTLGQLRRLLPKIRALSTVGIQMGEKDIVSLVEVVTAALQRNYPDMTPEALEELLDMGNANAVLMTVLTGSGLKQGGSDGGEPDWGSIYGLVATACGYSYPVIDEMTLLDYEELCQYWAKSPPTHLMVAAYLGVGKPVDASTSAQPAKSQKDAIAEILQGGGTAVVNQRLFEKNMPFTPTFDPTELFARKPERRGPATARN